MIKWTQKIEISDMFMEVQSSIYDQVVKDLLEESEKLYQKAIHNNEKPNDEQIEQTVMIKVANRYQISLKNKDGLPYNFL